MPNRLSQFEAIEGADYWVRMVKCQHACPVHTDACGYVTAIAEGRYEEAYRLARATNPFASICGRVCGAPCEANCRRGDVDEPVAIRAAEALCDRQVRSGNRRPRHLPSRPRPAHAAAQSRRLRTRGRYRRRRFRPDRGPRPGPGRATRSPFSKPTPSPAAC